MKGISAKGLLAAGISLLALACLEPSAAFGQTSTGHEFQTGWTAYSTFATSGTNLLDHREENRIQRFSNEKIWSLVGIFGRAQSSEFAELASAPFGQPRRLGKAQSPYAPASSSGRAQAHLGGTGRQSWAVALGAGIPRSSALAGGTNLAFTCPAGATCWVGGASGVWSSSSNWSNGVPTNTTNALIDNGNANGQGASAVTLDVNGATVKNLTVDSDDSLSFNNLTSLTVSGGSISNAGMITISGGNANNAFLNIGANTALSGGGTVNLSSEGGTAIIQGNGFTLTNTNNTIQGYGVIGNGSLALSNGGTVDATQSAVTLLLNGTGGITNTNLLEATNGGVLQIQNTINNAGGNITANNGTVVLVSADIQGGTLNTKNSGTLGALVGDTATLDGSTHGAVTLSAGSTYTGQFGSTTNVLGTINNAGNFLISGGNGSNALLNLSGNTTLQGGGTVTLTSEGGGAIIQGNGFTLTNTNNTIQGYGTIGNGSLALSNGGTVDATQPAVTLLLNGTGGITNTNLLEATNGGVLQIQNTINNAGGNITANGGTVNLLMGADIEGGTLNTKNGGTLGAPAPFGETVTLDGSTHGAVTLSAGSTYTDQFGSTTNVLGTINNAGNFLISGGNGSNALLNLSGNTTLQGGGTVTLTSEGGGAIIQGNGFTLTNAKNTIQGYGTIGNGTLSLINGPTGTIFATQPGVELLVNASGKITNNGTFKVASGTTLTVMNGAFTNFSGTTLTGGTYNTAGTLQINELGNSGGEIVTNAANIILSGTSSAFVDAMGNNALSAFNTNASNGNFTINSGRNFTTAGNFTNSGTLTVGSSNSKFDVNGNLTNFSDSTLTGGTYNVTGTLQFNGANIVTNAAKITLSGTSSSIVNQSAGNGLANFATNAAGASFTINSGRTFTTAGNFTNNGTLLVGSNNSKFHVNGSLTNFSGTKLTGGTYNLTGTLQFNGANIVTNAANITLSGMSSAIINQSNGNGLANFAVNASGGTFSLASGRTFTTSGNFSNAGTLNIASGTSFAAGGTGLFAQTSGLTKDDGMLTDSGGLDLNGGSLIGKGTVSGAIDNASGTIDPGDTSTSAGILTDKGAYTQGASGKLNIAIGGTTAGTQFDQLNATTAKLNGTLNVSRINGFLPTIGQKFKIMNFTSATGSFSSCTCAINSTEHFSVTVQGTDVLLTVVSGAAAVTPTNNVRSAAVLPDSHFGSLFAGRSGWNLRNLMLNTERNYEVQPGGGTRFQSFSRSMAVDVGEQIRSDDNTLAKKAATWRGTALGVPAAHPLTTWTREPLPSSLRISPKTSAYAYLPASSFSFVHDNVLRALVGSFTAAMQQTSTLANPMRMSSVGIVRMFSTIAPAETRMPEKFEFAANRSATVGSDAGHSSFRKQLEFAAPQLNTSPARPIHGRTKAFTAGFNFRLSNLRSMPTPMFGVQ